MICPYCKAEDQFVTLETRSREWGMKRLKKCLNCCGRFATIEIHEVSEDALNSLRRSRKILLSKRSKEK